MVYFIASCIHFCIVQIFRIFVDKYMQNILEVFISLKLRHHYGFSIKLTDKLSTVLIEDPTDDNPDALLCAIQAGWSYEQREHAYGIPANCDLLEGWIVGPDLLTNFGG